MASFPNWICHLKISSQMHFQWRICCCFDLRKLFFASLLDWILYSFSHYRVYILTGPLSFPPPPTVEILSLPLLNWHPPAGESRQYHWCQAAKPCMSAWLERKTLAWPGWYYFDFMWYFSLNWLEHFTRKTVLLFLAQSEEPFNNADFVYSLASLITSGVRGDRSNLDGAERGGCSGWCPDIVTGPML